MGNLTMAMPPGTLEWAGNALTEIGKRQTKSSVKTRRRGRANIDIIKYSQKKRLRYHIVKDLCRPRILLSEAIDDSLRTQLKRGKNVTRSGVTV